jgi:Fe-S-cluster-containing dehydrogenase component
VANEMAILQEVDKCIRCNGCVISCKRTWHMKGIVPTDDLPHNKLAANQRVVIKSQKRVDMGPFVRFSCWHCEDAPCQGRCPHKAITKDPDSGAVWIDPNKCEPGVANAAGVTCVHQCKIDCQRGGVPMIDIGSDLFETEKAWKCTLCKGYTGAVTSPYVGAGLGGDLPSKSPVTVVGEASLHYSPLYPGDAVNIPELAHQPSCVYTCPAKAMVYDTRANIIRYLNANYTSSANSSRFGDGSMFWASHKFVIAPPKADPFMEDHVAPMLSGLLSSPFAKAALAPTLVVGGLLALAARRAKIEEESLIASGEVR